MNYKHQIHTVSSISYSSSSLDGKTENELFTEIRTGADNNFRTIVIDISVRVELPNGETPLTLMTRDIFQRTDRNAGTPEDINKVVNANISDTLKRTDYDLQSLVSMCHIGKMNFPHLDSLAFEKRPVTENDEPKTMFS